MASRGRTDAPIQKIIALMTAGQWVPGASHKAIAEEFKLSPLTVKEHAHIANKVIRLAVEGDPEDIRARILATLSTVTALALGRTQVNPITGTEYPAPDLKAAVAACAEQAKLLGLVVQKHEVAAMTPEEADKLIAQAAQLAKAKAVA